MIHIFLILISLLRKLGFFNSINQLLNINKYIVYLIKYHKPKCQRREEITVETNITEATLEP